MIGAVLAVFVFSWLRDGGWDAILNAIHDDAWWAFVGKAAAVLIVVVLVYWLLPDGGDAGGSGANESYEECWTPGAGPVLCR